MTTPYADVDDVIATMPTSIRPAEGDDGDEARTRITSLCVTTREMIDAELGVDFGRSPAGDEDDPIERILDGRGSCVIHVHRGIVSLDSLELRWSASSDWDPLEDADWELVSYFPDEGERPFDHIRLTGTGRRYFPNGVRNVRGVGIWGWAAPPSRLVEANAAWVRQHLSASDSFAGSMTVPDGPTVVIPRLSIPDDVRILTTRETKRYQECWV